ncbi:MAG: hypothetical protein NTV61_11520 [Candidatus Bathyarchaeota archaeon]|nr:hypothetical protein [Candidatus Bathyarchaeota archaeon]
MSNPARAAQDSASSINETPVQGLTLSPTKLRELRRRLDRVEQLLKEAVKQ